MKEIKKEVKTFVVLAKCDKCDVDLEYEGVILPTNPPKYKYKCPICGNIENLGNKYPLITHEYIYRGLMEEDNI